MRLNEILDDYKRRTHVKSEDGEDYLIIPFFRPNESDSVQIKMYECDGDLYISDCKSTFTYLYDRLIDVEDYRDKIDRIKKRFYLKEKDGELILCFPSEDLCSIDMFIGFFIQGISAISCIYL